MSQSFDWMRATQLSGEVDKLANLAKEMELITSAWIGKVVDPRAIEKNHYDPKLEELKQQFGAQLIKVHQLALQQVARIERGESGLDGSVLSAAPGFRYAQPRLQNYPRNGARFTGPSNKPADEF